MVVVVVVVIPGAGRQRGNTERDFTTECGDVDSASLNNVASCMYRAIFVLQDSAESDLKIF